MWDQARPWAPNTAPNGIWSRVTPHRLVSKVGRRVLEAHCSSHPSSIDCPLVSCLIIDVYEWMTRINECMCVPPGQSKESFCWLTTCLHVCLSDPLAVSLSPEQTLHVSLSRVKWMSTSSLVQGKRRGTESLWRDRTLWVFAVLCVVVVTGL